MIESLGLSNITLTRLTQLLLVALAICIFIIYLLAKGMGSLTKSLQNMEEKFDQIFPALTETNFLMSTMLKICGIDKNVFIQKKKEEVEQDEHE